MNVISFIQYAEICSICFMRMRALLRNFNCPSCKTLLEQVVCSGDANKKFEDFQIWGESCGPDHQYDQKSQMFFPKDYYRTRIEPLWSCKCKMCPLVKRDLKGLRIHVSSDHNLQICSLCVEHRQSFPSEHKYYTKAEYEKHLRVGDGDGSQGHPYCEFCRKRYFDKTALFTHLMQDHYSCHICAKLGVQYKYYSDYETLEEHFRGEHFLCSEPECLMKKFVVFADAIDLQAHGLQFHPCSQVNTFHYCCVVAILLLDKRFSLSIYLLFFSVEFVCFVMCLNRNCRSIETFQYTSRSEEPLMISNLLPNLTSQRAEMKTMH